MPFKRRPRAPAWVSASIKGALAAAGRRAFGRHRLTGPVPGVAHSLYTLAVPGMAGPYLLSRGRVVISGFALDLARGRPLAVRLRLGSRTLPARPVGRPDLAVAFREIASLPLDCGFAVEARVRSGLTPLGVEVEGESGWTTIFRCPVLRFGNRLGPADGPPLPDRDRLPAPIAASKQTGITAIVLEAGSTGLGATLASLDAQTRPPAQTILVGSAAPAPHSAAIDLAAALAAASGDFLLPLRAGDRLDARALERLAAASYTEQRPDLVYADEEWIGPGRDLHLVFKPDWSPDTLETFDYVGTPAMFRTALARDLPASDPYDLALRFTERTQAVRHLRAVLCRRPNTAADASDGRAALAGRLDRTGRTGTVAPIAEGLAAYACRVEPPADHPLVSIVIPTAGREREIGGRVLNLVLNCVHSIRERSRYARIEIVVVVEAGLPPAVGTALRELACRTTLDAAPGFNFSRKCNLGAAAATGSFVILLNDDTEVIAPDWIERLLAQGLKPHVGAVGPKLLYPDGTIQHAGVVTLRGIPLHVREGFPGDDLGYRFSTAGARNYGAVTGACLMVRADLYKAVGGCCEDLPVNFNDVDLCLKLRRRGLHVVYEPACRLLHFASASRDPRVRPEELALFRERWAAEIADDPFYENAVFPTMPPCFEIVPS